jgi:sec-independent protein translocase protein TatA
MFGLGPLELGAIAVAALLIFGPKKIPELGKTLGQATKSFRKASTEFEAELKRDADADLKKETKDTDAEGAKSNSSDAVDSSKSDKQA